MLVNEPLYWYEELTVPSRWFVGEEYPKEAAPADPLKATGPIITLEVTPVTILTSSVPFWAEERSK